MNLRERVFNHREFQHQLVLWRSFRRCRVNRPTYNLAFHTLVEYYLDVGASHGAIGKKIGVTSQAMSKIYETYVRLLFLDRSGQDLRMLEVQKIQACALRRAQAEKAQADAAYEQSLRNEDPFIRAILANVTARGYTFAFVPLNGEGRVDRHTFRINDNLCAGHYLESVHRTGLRGYYHFCMQPSKTVNTQFQVILGKAPEEVARTFIIPMSAFLERYPECTTRPVSLYPPVEDAARVIKSRRPFDWEQYENRWDLLAPKAHEPDSS